MEDIMLDKINFMETLRSVAEITKTSNEPLSREEIQSYFKDMELSKEQQEMVYQYLLTPQTEEEETVNQPVEEESDVIEPMKTEDEESDSLSDSAFFQMYLKDLKELKTHSKEELTALYERLLEGDESVISVLSDNWLLKVLELAKSYRSRNVNMEDVVQEGNIGLVFGLSNLCGSKDVIDIDGYLEQSIKESMEAFIDESVNDDDWENTVLAKATLIYEAQKALSEDLGRIPTREELCNYTKLTSEEIEDILGLSQNK